MGSVFSLVLILFVAVCISIGKSEKQRQARQKSVEEAQRNPQKYQDHRMDSSAEKARMAEERAEEKRRKRMNEAAEKALQSGRVSHGMQEKEASAERERPARKPSVTVTPEILSRAEQKTSRNFGVDEIVKSAKENTVCGSGFHTQTEDGESLMQQVEDLIVKGVDCSLSYERDFVGEGMDMISQYL